VGGLYESRAAFWLKLEYETTKTPRTQRTPRYLLLLNRGGAETRSFMGIRDQGLVTLNLMADGWRGACEDK